MVFDVFPPLNNAIYSWPPSQGQSDFLFRLRGSVSEGRCQGAGGCFIPTFSNQQGKEQIQPVHVPQLP